MTMIIQPNAYDKGSPSVVYDNLFTSGALTASSGVGENAVSGTTWDFWSGTGSSTLEVDLGSEIEIDCLFVDAHDLFTVGSSLVFEKWNGSNWVNVETVIPTDNSAIMIITEYTISSRYRVTATDANIGVVVLGKRLVFPNGVDGSHSSIPHSKKYEILGGDSLNGQFTGQKVIRRSADLSVTFPLIDSNWVDTEMSDFEEHYNVGKPFVWAANPAFRGDDMGFCQRPEGASELMPSYSSNGMYEDFTMSMGVYINA